MNKPMQQMGQMVPERMDEHIQRFMPTSFNFRSGESHLVLTLSSEEIRQVAPQTLVENVVRCELNMSFVQAKMMADAIYNVLSQKGFVPPVMIDEDKE